MCSGLASGRMPCSTATSPPLPPVHWRRGKFLGSGAYGQVFCALDEDTGRLIAVKEVCPQLLQLFTSYCSAFT